MTGMANHARSDKEGIENIYKRERRMGGSIERFVARGANALISAATGGELIYSCVPSRSK